MEKSVSVKQNPIMARVALLLIALIFGGSAVALLIIAVYDSQLWVAFGFFIVAALCVFFSLTAKLYIKAIDIYTETGMVRKRGEKILYELAWTNVEKITYNKLSLVSILMFGPTAFMVFQKEPPKDKNRAKIFMTYYSKKEIMKIQSVIPIEIQFVC